MARRLITCLLLASCSLTLPDRLSAQQAAFSPGLAPAHSPPPAAPYGWAPGAGTPMMHPSAAWPGGAAPPPPVPFPYGAPPALPAPAHPIPGVGYHGPDGIITRQLPREDHWDESGPLEMFLTQMARGSWVRLEYMLWDVKRPGNVLLGAPLAENLDPRRPFPVFSIDIPPELLGFARVADLGDIRLENVNGLRGTLGIETRLGDVELSLFGLDRAFDQHVATDIPQIIELVDPQDPDEVIPGQRFVATSLLLNGQISNLVLLYNDFFVASYVHKFHGAEAKIVFDTAPPGEGFKMRPLLGYQALRIRERLTQVGGFDDPQDILPPFVRTIDSQTSNFHHGLVGGLRLALEHRWFSVGLEPKLGLGVNTYSARVSTHNLRDPGDPLTTTTGRGVLFSPVGEIGAFARLNIRDSLSLFFSYNFLVAGGVTRPFDNILYNDVGPNAPPGVVLHTRKDYIHYHGLTAGAEIRFR